MLEIFHAAAELNIPLTAEKRDCLAEFAKNPLAAEKLLAAAEKVTEFLWALHYATNVLYGKNCLPPKDFTQPFDTIPFLQNAYSSMTKHVFFGEESDSEMVGYLKRGHSPNPARLSVYCEEILVAYRLAKGTPEKIAEIEKIRSEYLGLSREESVRKTMSDVYLREGESGVVWTWPKPVGVLESFVNAEIVLRKKLLEMLEELPNLPGFETFSFDAFLKTGATDVFSE